MRNFLRRTVLLALPLLLCACPGPVKPTSIVDIGPGWNCLAYPSAFRDSGVVFALSTQDGSATTFKDFHATPGVVINSADFVDTSASRSNNVSASVLAGMLGLPVKAGASASTMFSVTQTFSNATQTDVDQASDTLLKNAFYASPDLQQATTAGATSGAKYYLIRNTIRALTISYNFDRDISAALDVTVPVHAATGEIKAGLDDSSGLKYSKTFATPEDVCLQVEQLPVPRPGAGAVAAGPPLITEHMVGAGDQPLFTSYKP